MASGDISEGHLGEPPHQGFTLMVSPNSCFLFLRIFPKLGGLVGTHRELSKRSLRAKKRPVRAKNGQLERKKGQFERKNGQVERKSAFEVPSGLPKKFKSARTRQLRASKSVMRAAKGRRSPKPPRPLSVISRWISALDKLFESKLLKEIFTTIFYFPKFQGGTL